MTTVPQPILAFIQASNRGDAAAVVACFTSTAVLDDWGRHFAGHSGIADWNRTDNAGVQAKLKIVGAQTDGDIVLVTVTVSGKGFNGTGHMSFQLEGERIARLSIH